MATIPELIRVPHPFGPGKRVASAFVVRGVHDPVGRFKPLAIEWLSRGEWRADPLPTRPEYLIRRGGDMVMRDVRAILELGPPYLRLSVYRSLPIAVARLLDVIAGRSHWPTAGAKRHQRRGWRQQPSAR
jgi:hypothetical protein